MRQNRLQVGKTLYKQRYLQLMVIPWIIWLLIFCYLPMGGIVLAFKEFSFRGGIWGSPWVGMKQFQDFFGNPEFGNILRNTLSINLLRLIFSFPAPILLAIMINELSSTKLKRTVQSLSYLPHFISWVIITGILFKFLTSQGGILNDLLLKIGLIQKPIMFLGENKYFWWIVVFSGMWKETGWNTILYLAAISAVDAGLYEAAIVDGASRFRKIWNITLPSILPTITICMLFTISNILTAGFDQLFLLGNKTNVAVAEVLDTYVYKSGIAQGRYSYATAAGLFISIIGFGLIISTNKMANKLTGHGIW